MKRLTFIFICIIPLVFAGCAHMVKARKLMTISLGMDKQQIINMLGEPIIVRGSMTNKFGQIIEVWEYYIRKEHTSGAKAVITLTMGALFLIGGQEETYWFYFYDNKLVQWCKAGDWETAAHNIQEIRFR